MESRLTIAIGRQMGSGGSYIGQLIAGRLGLKYLDREIIRRLAGECGLAEAEVAARAERLSSFWQKLLGPLRLGPPDAPYIPPPVVELSDQELFEHLRDVLKSFAEEGNCIIIGLAAAHILRPRPGLLKVFLHAPLDFRVRRVMEIYRTENEEQARSMIEESDEMRKRYIARMTGHDWKCASHYHLTLDSSLFPLNETAEIIAEFACRRLSA